MPPANQPGSVVVHPLVLLSVVDHFNRVSSDQNKRVVGILLGENHRGQVDITNSYAVPFEEDSKDPTIWFLDHNYHENMFAMFKKVNATEKVVGWYSTGPKIRPADLEINELLRRFTPNPVLCIIDVNPSTDFEIPTEAYISVEENLKNTKSTSEIRRTFMHLPTEVGAYEAEEVGVEHLLRDIRDTTESTLADQINTKWASLKGLHRRLEQIHTYLADVEAGRLPVNHQIIYNIQDIFNLSPNLQVQEVVRAFQVKSNDNAEVIFLSSLIRAIIALHNLINNKIMNQQLEQDKRKGKKPGDSADKDKEKEKDKTADDKKEKTSESANAAADKSK